MRVPAATQHRARFEERIGSTITTGPDEGARGFKLERLLGWGSTSAVYEASSARGEPGRFALKILHPSWCGNRAVVARFRRELVVSKTVAHPAIVAVRCAGTHEGAAFLVLELLEGETLEDRRIREGGRLPLEVVAPTAEELLSALAAVHEKGIVHRDVKPQNVFLTTSTQIKLLDFGTARLLEPEPGEPVSVDGLVIGTPSFMSPEQARGEQANIDARSDVWSVGATLFTLLSGEYVHVERDAHQRLLAAATRPARSLGAVRSLEGRLDAKVVACIDRALAFDRNARWPDVMTMRSALSLG